MTEVHDCFRKIPSWHSQDWEGVHDTLKKTAEIFLSVQEKENSTFLSAQGYSNSSVKKMGEVYQRFLNSEPLSSVREIKNFFESFFTLFRLSPDPKNAYLTGYYEPLLSASLTPSDRFRFPLFTLAIQNSLESGPTGISVFKKYARRDFYLTPLTQKENVTPLIWLEDPVARYFLEVQGSGQFVLPSGVKCRVTSQATSGHPYVPLSRKLFDEGGVSSSQFLNKDHFESFLKTLPIDGGGGLLEILSLNPRFVYFEMRVDQSAEDNEGPWGTFGKNETEKKGISLTPGRSLAVDQSLIPLGFPVWIETTSKLPPLLEGMFPRLMFTHDTGGAILGRGRGDVFFGTGSLAEKKAGLLNHSAQMYLFLPQEENRA